MEIWVWIPLKSRNFFSGLFAVVQIAITTATIISSLKSLYFRSSHHLHVSFLLWDELNKLATCTSPIMHRISPPKKFCITLVFHFSWVLQPSQDKLKTRPIELWETCKWRIGLLPMYGSSYLKWWSTAALTQRPWVRIPLKSRKFFAVYLQLLKLQLPMQRSYLHLTIIHMRDVRRNDYSSLQSFIGWRGHFDAQPDGLLLHYIFHAFWTLRIVKLKNSLKNLNFSSFSNN